MQDSKRRGMTAADLFRISTASDAQISPDGSRIAFVLTRMDEEKDEYLATIWMVAAAGGEPQQFTAGPKRDTAPRWSPDGRLLAFVSERDDKKPQIYVMPVDGGEPQRLTEMKSAVSEPVWSPDGDRIAFTTRCAADEATEQDEEKEKSKPARVITSLRYKSNGEGFVYDRHRHIFVVPTAGGEAKQITDGDWDDGGPTWSPDGRSIAFSSARHEERDYDQVSDIWIVAAEGGEPHRLTPGRGPCAFPAWSLDGALIAYAGNEYALDMGRNYRIYTIAAAGGEPRCLTESLDRTYTSMGALGPLWSADSKQIYFGIEDQGSLPGYRVAAAGDTAAEQVIGGDRQLTGISIARQTGAIAYCATSSVGPAEVGVQVSGEGAGRQLSQFNRAFKDEVELVQPERCRFERDGYTIDCWVMKPVGYEPGRRYPALLNIHGGPATQYGYSFHDEFQVQAGAGYAVIFCNPRGSQGYGETFTRAVRGDWGGGDYHDVSMAMDEALQRFDFIDPERLGVLGGSYGGFMTSWMVGHTDRFKAACSERAVNNTYTLFGTSDIGSSFSETQAGATPWDDMQWFIDHSPLTYAKQINTPLLILHSEDDLRCPIEQAEQLFTVLKKLRREVLFVRFPDENHELSRSGKPQHRRDRFGFILDWFVKYLTPSVFTEQAKTVAAAD